MITGKDTREEFRNPVFDLLRSIRGRRLKWAGEVLRREETYLPRRVALAELRRYEGGKAGGIFQDAPKGVSVEELVELANLQGFWGERVDSIRGTKYVRVIADDD
jgi:hypothetical protein